MTKRAIIHVDDAEGIISLAEYLVSDDWTIISANKTEELLKKSKIPVTREQALIESNSYVNDIALFNKEILSTRLETPSYDSHNSEYNTNNIFLVCINMIPSIAKHQIGKPGDYTISTFLRSAYQNYENILILTDPADYREAIIQLKTDSISDDFRKYLAGKALNMLAAYDAGIATSLLNQSSFATAFHNYPVYPFKKEFMLKSGSNSHQQACFYKFPEIRFPEDFFTLTKKNFSYNSYNDISLVWEILDMLSSTLKTQSTVSSTNNDGYEFTTQFTPLTGSVFTIAIKYQNLLGASLSSNILDSFDKTYSFDTENIVNGTFGCSAVIDANAAHKIVNSNFSTIVAPDFTAEARAILAENKKLQLIPIVKLTRSNLEGHFIYGGLLIQQQDMTLFNHWSIKTKNRPSQIKADALAFGMLLAMKTRSYSAIILKQNATIGIAQSATSAKKAIQEVLFEAKETVARKNIQLSESEPIGDVLICDSTAPFCDEIKELIRLGISAIIETGDAANKEADFVSYCDENGIVLVHTGMTHIKI